MSDRPTPLADLWSGALGLGLAACGAFALLNAWAPPQDLPWKPLDLRLPLGRATAVKIAALDLPASATPEAVEASTAQCLALLRQAGVEAERAPDRNDGGFCIVQGAVRLTGGDLTPLSPGGVTMRCPMAMRHLLWDREVVRPAARAFLGAEAAGFLRRLRDGGCRLFANVLTPDYNAAHRDHFHLDAAPRGVCARAAR